MHQILDSLIIRIIILSLIVILFITCCVIKFCCPKKNLKNIQNNSIQLTEIINLPA